MPSLIMSPFMFVCIYIYIYMPSLNMSPVDRIPAPKCQDALWACQRVFACTLSVSASPSLHSKRVSES